MIIFIVQLVDALRGETWVTDQVFGQDGWILAKFFFCMFMDGYKVEVHKLAKKNKAKYPAILTEQAWSIKDSLYGFQRNVLAGYSRYSRVGKIAPSCSLG